MTDVAANGRLVRIAASQHGTKPSGQNGVVKNRRFRSGQKRTSFVRGDHREEPLAAVRRHDCSRFAHTALGVIRPYVVANNLLIEDARPNLAQMEDAKRHYGLGLLLVTVAAVAWSTSGLFTRFLTVDIATILFWRGFFGVLGTLALMPLLRGSGGYRSFWRLGRAGCAYAAVTAASMLFFISALLNTTVAHVAIITSIVPLMAALLGWLILREKPSGSAILASLAALIGVAVMVGVSSDGRLFGDILALIMTVLMAGMILISRRYQGIPALAATCLASALSALAVLPFADVASVGSDQLIILAAFALVNQVLGFGLFALGARWLPPTQSALILALEAPLAPLWVWLILAETPGSATLLGGGIVLLAVLGYILWAGRRGK